MKIKTLLLFILSITSLNIFSQTTWNVEAGGTPDAGNPDPYFSPQFITIQLGDEVVWTNIQGWHNIDMTSGPVDFSMPDSGAGWVHNFTFNVAGVYEYECGVGEHALTQFGTITVEGPNSIEDINSLSKIAIYNNAIYNEIQIEGLTENINHTISIYSITGKLIKKEFFKNVLSYTMSTSTLNSGTYIISIENNETVITEKVIIQ